ncbi:MAG: ribonucleoside-diphosphate reductase, adenosylcobalamin-dependent, partial [Candidatus Methanomethylophilaceae archaeon]|nr:ribonucleoside-diphosphate reductase, adenosylcobalamin-dependent [Candidatus Methanomethylophilaceae archaeon]
MEIDDWLGEGNTLGTDIWEKKYRHNGESFEEWLDRVSAGNDDLKTLIREKKFLFGGRILANRGLQNDGLKVTLSNCYVLSSPEDSIESIFETAGKLARTFSYGGGAGIDISKLAPRGAKINNTASQTSGAVSFTDLYSMVTGLIGQHGRRGALMLTISCEHPDLEEFMMVKTDLERVTKANMSIRKTDAFMKCVRDRESFTQRFYRPESKEEIVKKISAADFFGKMCSANWDYGEPGCLFWDRISSWNLLSEFPDYSYESTNPCAEEPLPAGGSCLLGSINLSAFVHNGVFDMADFIKSVRICVRALNDVLDEGLPL